MIDTKELRRLAQAATPHVGHACKYQDAHWLREGHVDFENADLFIASERPQEDAAFYAAANPTAVIEILDRLEDAESDALEQARLNGMGSEREAALMAKLEAAERARDFAKTEIARLHDDVRELTDVRVLDEEDRDRIVALQRGNGKTPHQLHTEAEQERDALRAEIEELHALIAAVKKQADVEFCLRVKKEEEYARLRAKSEATERQEPVAWATKLALEYGASTLGFQVSGVNMWGEKGVPLYALPGARGEEK